MNARQRRCPQSLMSSDVVPHACLMSGACGNLNSHSSGQARPLCAAHYMRVEFTAFTHNLYLTIMYNILPTVSELYLETHQPVPHIQPLPGRAWTSEGPGPRKGLDLCTLGRTTPPTCAAFRQPANTLTPPLPHAPHPPQACRRAVPGTAAPQQKQQGRDAEDVIRDQCLRAAYAAAFFLAPFFFASILTLARL